MIRMRTQDGKRCASLMGLSEEGQGGMVNVCPESLR